MALALDSCDPLPMSWLARRLPWLRRVLHRPAPAPRQAPSTLSGASLLPSYVALGRWRPGHAALDARLELLIGQLSAELSTCRWCIDQGRHRWRKALLPAHLLSQLRGYRTSTSFSERDRAALVLTEAVIRYTDRDPVAGDEALAGARRYFTESEVARIAQVAAGEHFFDPVTGAVGQDVREEASAGAEAWEAIGSGIGVRGWS
jgi:alkylhydroperoxidase family enzyme